MWWGSWCAKGDAESFCVAAVAASASSRARPSALFAAFSARSAACREYLDSRGRICTWSHACTYAHGHNCRTARPSLRRALASGRRRRTGIGCVARQVSAGAGGTPTRHTSRPPPGRRRCASRAWPPGRQARLLGTVLRKVALQSADAGLTACKCNKPTRTRGRYKPPSGLLASLRLLSRGRR